MKTTEPHFWHTPYTVFGKWSLGLAIVMIAFFFIGSSAVSVLYPAAQAGNTITEDFANRPALAISMLLGMAAGILGFITGVVAFAKQHERSSLVYLSTLIGAALLFFLLGEFIFPH